MTRFSATVLFAAVFSLASLFLSSESRAQQSYPNIGPDIEIWNTGFFGAGRGDVQGRLYARFWNFDAPSVRNFVIATNIGEFVFEGEFDNSFEVLGSAEIHVRPADLVGDLTVTKATGVIGGVTYDLTLNVKAIEPPDPPMEMRVPRASMGSYSHR
ncbi:MAG: hypothetical protein LBQ12_01045 [Deltaproteobacteria bacterium]|jgi:hypothetical protein|nr:hypothetical protein [Deltaproteobacteria bacterium]